MLFSRLDEVIGTTVTSAQVWKDISLSKFGIMNAMRIFFGTTLIREIFGGERLELASNVLVTFGTLIYAKMSLHGSAFYVVVTQVIAGSAVALCHQRVGRPRLVVMALQWTLLKVSVTIEDCLCAFNLQYVPP